MCPNVGSWMWIDTWWPCVSLYLSLKSREGLELIEFYSIVCLVRNNLLVKNMKHFISLSALTNFNCFNCINLLMNDSKVYNAYRLINFRGGVNVSTL